MADSGDADAASLGQRAPRLPFRYVIVALLFGCNICLYCSRACITVAVIYMFPKDENIEGTLLCAFYAGYSLTQIAGGWLAARVPANRVLVAIVVTWSAATVATAAAGPSLGAARTPLLFALRMIVGAAEGPNYPAQVELQSRWIPYRERATAWAIAGAGESIGTFLALLVGPYLVHSFGWESVFVASGAIGLLWAAAFAFLGARSPAAHRCVGGAERAHIEASRPPQTPRTATPWRRIATNVPFLALIFTHCAFNWTGYLVASWLDKFFVTTYNVKYDELGVLSVLPYLMMLVVGLLGGPLADALERRRCLGATSVRKLFNTCGMGGQAILLLVLAAIVPATKAGGGGAQDHHGAVAAALVLAFSSGISALCTSGGYWVNFVDLSPRHAQLLLGISNSVASIPGLVGQLLTGQILASTHDDFAVIFQIAAAVNGAGALVFLAFGAGRDQRYDEPRGGGGGLGAAAVAPLGAKLLADDDGAAAASGS